MALLSKQGISGFMLAAVAGASHANNALNLQQPVTQIAEQIYDMHTLMLIICLVIFIVVFGIMFYSIFAHRKSKGAVAAQFHENTTVEILWTIIPIFILLGMALPATKTVIAMKDTSDADITVKATGYQWKWGYDYIKGEGEGTHFFSSLSTPRDQIEGRAGKGENYLLEVDNPLVVPVGKKIRILTTANDVIHAWWVPAFGVKQDAIPGFIRDTWFRAEKEGVYRGSCAELCGKDHGFMPIEVHVVSQDQYASWVADQKKKAVATADDPNKQYTLEELKERGSKVYAANCVACHQASGKGTPPAFPALDGSKMVIGPIAEHAKAVLDGVVRDGKPTAMAAFGKQLSDVEVAAVVAYERNSWGNHTGDFLQPSAVKTLRSGGTVAAAAAAAPAAAAAAAAATATTTAAASADPAAAPSTASAAAEPSREPAQAQQADSEVMPARVYFDTGKAELNAEAQAVVKAAAAYLGTHGSASVDITGYTDKSGSVDKNLELAKERAKAVRTALSAAGVAPERINMKPPATVTGDGSKKEARRVEINVAG